jgi:hypothetical protein
MICHHWELKTMEFQEGSQMHLEGTKLEQSPLTTLSPE